MGMYTEFVCSMELSHKTPKEVIGILEYMVDPVNIDEDSIIVPDNNFFWCDRWRYLFIMDSYCFSGITNTKLEINNGIFLTIRSNLKNYNNEIEKFLLWVKPYMVDYQSDFLGYMRCEEDENPRLLYRSKMTTLENNL